MDELKQIILNKIKNNEPIDFIVNGLKYIFQICFKNKKKISYLDYMCNNHISPQYHASEEIQNNKDNMHNISIVLKNKLANPHNIRET